MKICPKCGTEFSDSENFCIDCGRKLEAAEKHDETHTNLAAEIEQLSAQMAQLKKESESRQEEASSAVSAGITKLAGRLGSMEKHIYKQPKPHANEDITSVESCVRDLEKRIGKIEKSVSEIDVPEGIKPKIAQLEKQVARAGKEALRVAKAKHMPDSEATSMASDIGELEKRLDALEIKLEHILKPEGPVLPMERRISAMEKKTDSMNSGLKSFVSVLKENENALVSMESKMREFAKHGDIAELSRTTAAENEKIAAMLDEISSLKRNMEKSMKSSASSNERRLMKWLDKAKSTFATKEQMDGMTGELDARVAERLKPIENFREKVMVVAGLAAEQHEKFKQFKSSIADLVDRKVAQSEAMLSRHMEQIKSRTDDSTASCNAAAESLKAKLDSESASLGESISHVEEFENRISGEFDALKESSASRSDIEAIKELAESYNARLSTFKQMLASHTKAIDELSQTKSQTQAEQEQAIDRLNSRINEAIKEVRMQGNSIVVDMERKMNDSISAGLRSMEDAKSRTEGEMKLVLDTLSRSQGFDKAVQSELAVLKAELGEFNKKIKAAVSEEKGALDDAIKMELNRLQRISRDAEQKFGLLKDGWSKAIKDSIKKNSDEFDELKKAYSESLEKTRNVESYVNFVVGKRMKDINRMISEESKANSSARKDMKNALAEAMAIGKDSREKLAMVKDFIANVESRFGSEMEGLDKRMDRLAKIQQKMELEGISHGRKPK